MDRIAASLSTDLDHDLGASALRGVFDAIETGCCIIELLFDAEGRAFDHRYLAVNAAFERHTGLADARGRRVRELVPDYEARWSALYAEVLRTGIPARVTERTRGLGRWFDVSASRLGGPDSHRLVLLFEDVTAREQARNELAATQGRLEATLSAGEIGTWTWDIERDQVVADRNLVRIFGLSAEGAPSRPIAEYTDHIHPDDRERVLRTIQHSIASGSAFEAAYRIVRADGALRWVIARGQTENDDAGRPARLPGVVLDVTEQRAAEQALRLSETRLHLALRAGHMGTWELDLTHDTLQCSSVFRANFGRSADEPLTYADVEAAVEESDREAWNEAMAAVRSAVRLDERTTSSFELEVRVRWPDASVHWVALRAEGAQHLLSGVAILVDERKATEESLRAADRQKDEFLATASHELRTPLNAILGWARLLRSGKLDPSASLRGIETIERNAIAQVRVIEDILDGSRIVTGKLRLELRPVDMTALVSAALDAIRPAAEAKQIELSVQVDPDAARLTGDPDRLQQVVWNLANNAIKFTAKGGRVRVELARVGPHVELTVSDSGRGIPASFLPHVFERFRQLDGGTTRRHGGLGLGLALVRHLAEAHGGSARAESPGEGLGATFTVTLPVRAVHTDHPTIERRGSRPDAERPLALDTLDGITVLVVDDEADARDLVATVLRASGAEVNVAASAEQALETLATFTPTVLVSDIGMPDVDGYELIRRVRSNLGTRGAELPAIALTAFAREEDRRLALAAGFQNHVAKPVEPAELVRLVEDLVRESRREPTGKPMGAVRRADPVAKLERVLATRGIPAALRFLNDRTAHRFTGLYRFDDPLLKNLFLIDAEAPDIEHGTDAPLHETYCSIVGETTRTFTTEDTRRDDRVRNHPARDSVVSYCGVLLRDADGTPFGTLCHFDVCPSDVPVSEMPLLETAAQALMNALVSAGLG